MKPYLLLVETGTKKLVPIVGTSFFSYSTSTYNRYKFLVPVSTKYQISVINQNG